MKTYEEARDEAALKDAIEDNDRRGHVKGHEGAVRQAFVRGSDWDNARELKVIEKLKAALQRTYENGWEYRQHVNRVLAELEEPGETI